MSTAGNDKAGDRAAHPPQHAHAVLHCNLNTVDLGRAEPFYTGLFDLDARMRSVSEGSDSTALGLGPGTASTTTFLYDRRGPRAVPALELVGWRNPKTTPRSRDVSPPGYMGIGYRVPSLDAVADRLASVGGAGERVAGGLTVRGKQRPGMRLTDPDGVSVEIVEVGAADGDPEGGLISHERLRCSDLERTVDWFAGLGWTVRARHEDEGPAASLVLPEDPTFSLELTQRPAAYRGSGQALANTQGLYRVALAVDDVRAAHAALAVARPETPEPVFIPMPDVPTRGFTVLFLADPDGNVVELVERPRSAVRRPSEPD